MYNSLAEDQHGNISAEFEIKGDKNIVNLNTKVTRSCDLSVKKLVECKKNILQCMADNNIIDQTKEDSLSGLMSAEGNLNKDRLHLLEASKRILANNFIKGINNNYFLLKHRENNHF